MKKPNKITSTVNAVEVALVETTEVQKTPDKIMLQVNGKCREFDYQHGMKILNMPNNGGWQLADDKQDGINNSANKRELKSTKEEEYNK